MGEEKTQLQAELEVTCSRMERLIAMNGTATMDQDECNRQVAEYDARYNKIRQHIGKRGKLAEYLETLKNQGFIPSFNERVRHGKAGACNK